MTEQFYIKHSRYVYAVVFLVSVVLLLTEGHIDPASEFWKTLCHELGFAGIVSVILIFTIESLTRERHRIATDALLADINNNLFHAIYKRYIPEKVFSEVEKCVMRSNVFRSKHTLNYTIDEIASTEAHPNLKQEYFQCTAETGYTLTNVLNCAVQHDVVVQIELPIDKSLAHYCSFNEVVIGQRKFTGRILDERVSTTEQHLVFRMKITIEGGGQVLISTCSSLLKKKTDSEVWCSRLPSDGLTLTVTAPKKGVVLNAYANHSEALDRKLAGPVTYKWVLDFGIFPFQSIIFWWTSV